MVDTAPSGVSSRRSDRFAKLLHAFLNDLKPVRTTRDAQQFLQAIFNLEDHGLCVEKIGCNEVGLEVFRRCLRFDIGITFINGDLTDLLAYVAVPEVKRLANGEYLKRVLTQVVSPPALWAAMVTAHKHNQLLPKAELNFAWLLLELLTWTGKCPVEVRSIASDINEKKSFLKSENPDLRGIGLRIEHIFRAKATGLTSQYFGPGGRHDNDFPDYRNIAVYPTEDELTSKERPFYRTAQALLQCPLDERVAHHLDNQFRLLREDFLAELREDLNASSGKSKTSHRRQRTRLQKLRLVQMYCGAQRSRQPASLAISVQKGLEQISKAADPAKFLRDNLNVLRNRSFGYFVDQGALIGFGTIYRIESLLCESPPVVTIQTSGNGALGKVLFALASSNSVEFVLIDTAVFAYEPILRCLQDKTELRLWEPLLAPSATSLDLTSHIVSESLSELITKVESAMPETDFQALLGLSKKAVLDRSQIASLLAGLRQCVSLIQGPPGTGKSFVGALLAKVLYELTEERILVICYTNHALDQFLEDMMAIGIPSSGIVRLGSKSSSKTRHLNIREQTRAKSAKDWDAINRLNDEASHHEDMLRDSVDSLLAIVDSNSELLEHLEFSSDDYAFYTAFEVPEEQDGFQRMGKNNNPIDQFYLLDRWIKGKDPGTFTAQLLQSHAEIWKMGIAARDNKLKQWKLEMLEDEIQNIKEKAAIFDATQHTLQEALGQQATEVIQNRRIVACTTTAAAMYTKQLQIASPDVILVEEAGEILESHILTAMTPSTKQLILIGDHQQLRPKVNNYSLTVEKGDGYDLNRSLFERLVVSEFPHTTLMQQHRMCPEISSLVRCLTYPDLSDAPSTANRESLRGVQQRVIFIRHEQRELASHIADRRDQGASVSKQNEYEVKIVKKIVKYFAQQGYGTSNQVVLTPYLGQLGLLRRELAQDNDPVLNDLDSFDLVKAGLILPASASQIKRPLRLSTIDNYQGEESDIVIVSLTRSNPDGDIGFMVSPERLNVLLSRARKGLILIGNPATFMASRKGGELWSSFLDILARTNSMFSGLPVQCEQHKDRKMVLETPLDFDKYCPDGGCSASCGSLLPCGTHKCPRKCHRVADHSKTKCTHLMADKCPQGHVRRWKCFENHPTSCHFCDAEAAATLARQERDLELEQRRQANQAAYAQRLASIEDQIARIRDETKSRGEREEQESHLAQRQKDLEQAQARAAKKRAADQAAQLRKAQQSASTPKSTRPQDIAVPAKSETHQAAKDQNSEARLDWEGQKAIEGAQNPALDDLMDMIGLESVKEQFLEIKAKIDLLIRQDLPNGIKRERFGTAMLGNPGTGKTTVARLYAKFLCTIGALPGDDFVEASGARLASDGVQGCKKLLDNLLNKGGGAFFIDEAYQLISGASLGGGAVLDFLLNEVENLTGKVVFIVAGYNKQMEKFFQHNPGIPSRFPSRLQFADYEDDELLAIMNFSLDKRYDGRMKLEDGRHGLYARIVARRIGRGRGKEGFGNAREVENVMANIASRQARRLRKERKAAKKVDTTPDDMLFTKEDLIGPEPSNALAKCKAWIKLQKLTGLRSVKESVRALVDSLTHNYQRELAEEPLVEFTLNKVFLGNPGTGKTTVAKQYGQILADIGMLSSGEVVVKKPADFIGSVLGASEANTKAIMDATVGKVLLIDEAYGLHANERIGDPYRTAVIDTIVAEVQNVPGDDRCVLLLGYKEQMEELMQKSNPGLARRFPIDSAFVFEDFDDEDMAEIFDMKLKDIGFQVTPQAKNVALGMLQRARNRPHFGNAGEIDNLLNSAKLCQQKRLACSTSAPKNVLEAQDIDPNFDRSERAVTNIAMLFKDTVGCEKIITKLEEYQIITANMKTLNQDPREQIPFAFLFRGPPGTGKTTTAQKMGKVFYDMGFLASAEVVSCSASDLVGEYIGQTGPKTRKLLESALGKVLFIDEAYRLAGGHFAQEAMDELVDCMTKDQFRQKLIIILAGYDADINRLMAANPGLTSRFPEAIVFDPLQPQSCLDLLTKSLSKRKGLDITTLSAITPELQTDILQKFAILARSANFANARDVQTLSKALYAKVIRLPDAATSGMKITPTLVLETIDGMITERCQRQADASMASARTDSVGIRLPTQPPPQQKPLDHPAHRTATNSATKQDGQQEAEEKKETIEDSDSSDESDHPPSVISVHRDVGVSDAIWNQLQLDRQKAEDAEREYQAMLEEKRKLEKWLKACADAQRQKELEVLERKRKEAEAKRQREMKTLHMLKQMGRCPVGYEWIKQAGGYRCAGGSHWLDDAQTKDLMKNW